MDNNSEDCVTYHTVDQSDGKCFLLIGEHENQVSEGGESDLHKHKNNCKKNPGHPNFIAIESFTLKHLPEGLQNHDLHEYIKAVADLTVKLSVNITSPNRPEFWQNSQIPYFLSNMRGKKTLRTGSGMVWEVWKYTDQDKHLKYGQTTCPCDKCRASDEPSKVWWEISVETAAHLIVDDIEASHTTLRLVYDREDSNMVIFKDKVCVCSVNIKQDWCYLSCVTCDEILGNKLKKMEDHFDDVWKDVEYRYSKSSYTDKFHFVVSHPHGCNKQVSLCQWKKQVQEREDIYLYKLTYTTCTCPGSSGAFVHSVGFNRFYRVHCGSLKTGLNYSSVR